MLLNEIQYRFINDWMVIKELAVMFATPLLGIFRLSQGRTVFELREQKLISTVLQNNTLQRADKPLQGQWSTNIYFFCKG